MVVKLFELSMMGVVTGSVEGVTATPIKCGGLSGRDGGREGVWSNIVGVWLAVTLGGSI